MKFLLLYYFDVRAWTLMPPEEKATAHQRIRSWRQDQALAQRLVHTGEVRGIEETIGVFLGPADTPRIRKWSPVHSWRHRRRCANISSSRPPTMMKSSR